MQNRWKTIYGLLAATALLLCACGQGVPESAMEISEEEVTVTSEAASAGEGYTVNPCYTLSVPTQITKVGDDYFIVDCYHSRIIYSEDVTTPLQEWLVLTENNSSGYDMGHTICSDGEVILADDTENSRVLVFAKKGESWEYVQQIGNVGDKPHYVVYDETTDRFYCWSSCTGQMYVFENTGAEEEPVQLCGVITFEKLLHTYIRTFTIDDDTLWFVSGIPTEADGVHEIVSYDFAALTKDAEALFAEGADEVIVPADSTLEEEEISVPDEAAGMVQMARIGSKWYFTVSTDLSGNQDAADIIRADSPEDLTDGNYESVYSTYFVGGGTPYYLGCIDGTWYLTEHRLTDHAIWSFEADEDGNITDVTALF